MNEPTGTYGSPNTGCLIGTAYQVMLGELSTALESAGLPLTTGEYLILRILYQHDGLQQCEIAASLGKDKGAICRSVSGMVRKGLVSARSVSHKCRRVFLTPMAEEMKPAVMKVATERDEHLTSMVSQEEMEIFTTVLYKIIESKTN